jgi:HSP20 family molecular chaperone IbpA
MATPKKALTSQASMATAPRFVSSAESEALDGAIRDRIADRAYQLYETSGHVPGYDREHWLAAEAEVLRHGLEVRESGSWVVINGSLPDVAAEDLEIYVDARRIIICAKPSGAASADGPASGTFLVADLNTQVEPATASAALKNGTLTLMVKKSSPSQVEPIRFAT